MLRVWTASWLLLTGALVAACGDKLTVDAPDSAPAQRDAAIPQRDAAAPQTDAAAPQTDAATPQTDAAVCGTDAGEEPDPYFADLAGVTIDTYPRVDGSTSNIPLALVIACELLGVPWKWSAAWDASNEDYTMQVVPDPQTPAQAAVAEAIMTTIVHHKTHEAYVRLIDGSTDLILVASAPSPDEADLAAASCVELVTRPVARDALVFLVNSQNPISGLTSEQVRGIYMKEITNWSSVGGPAGTIAAFARPENSGSQQLMETVVMVGLTMPEWPQEMVAMGMGGLVDMVKSSPAGIGYSVYYYLMHMVNTVGLKLIAIDDVFPTKTTIGDGSFPFVADVLVVTRMDLDPRSLAHQMRDWLLAPEGQAVVAASDYVPVLR